MTGLVNTVKKVSDDIKMEFYLGNCSKGIFKRGKKISAEGIKVTDNKIIQDLEPDVYIHTFTWMRRMLLTTTK